MCVRGVRLVRFHEMFEKDSAITGLGCGCSCELSHFHTSLQANSGSLKSSGSDRLMCIVAWTMKSTRRWSFVQGRYLADGRTSFALLRLSVCVGSTRTVA